MIKMRLALLLLIIFLTFFLPLGNADACTSFAVYSNQVYYGMNFDYANLPMKFLISVNGDIRTFYLAFERRFGEMKFFVNTVGMNDRGLFSSCQELHPMDDTPREKTDANLYTFELFEAIGSCGSVEDIEEIGRNHPLVNMPGVTLHNLFADTSGRAMVTEATDSDTAIIPIKNNFMVMTNFPNQSMIGKPYQQAQGKGDQRYILCHEYLQKHAVDFTIEKGFHLLSMCRNKIPSTQKPFPWFLNPKNRRFISFWKEIFQKFFNCRLQKLGFNLLKGMQRISICP